MTALFFITTLGCGARTSLRVGTGGASALTDTSAVGVGGAGGTGTTSHVCNASQPIVTLASNLTWPYGIVVDDAFVYFVTYDNHDGALWRVPKASGAAVALASNLDYPDQLVLIGDSLYVTESGANRIIRVPKTGGALSVVADGQGGPAGIAFDGTSLFWASYFANEIVTSNLTGSTKVIDNPDAPFRIAVGFDRVYFTSLGSKVGWVMKDGSETGVIDFPGLNPRTVAVGPDGRVYWTDGGVLFADADGSNVMAFGDLENGTHFEGLALDADHLFSTVSEGDIVRFSLHEEPPDIIVTGQELPSLIAVDDSCIYWTNIGPGPGAGSVMRAPKDRPPVTP